MAVVGCILVFAPGRRATANLSLSLDNKSPTFDIPTSGSTTVYITGTATATGMDFPAALILAIPPRMFTTTGVQITLSMSVDTTAENFLQNTGGTYTGNLFDLTLTSTSTPGLYHQSQLYLSR
jgi:hypothetical protein